MASVFAKDLDFNSALNNSSYSYLNSSWLSHYNEETTKTSKYYDNQVEFWIVNK